MAENIAVAKREPKAVAKQSPQRTLADWFKEHSQKFMAVAPKEFDVNRMFFLYQQSISRNPKLAECTSTSLLAALMKCSELGLEPNSGLNHAHIIPFFNSKTNATEAQFIPGYKGLVKLAKDIRIDAVAVFEDEVKSNAFTVQQGTDPKIVHTPLVICDRSPEKLVAVYAIAFFKDGSFQFDWMTRNDVEAIKRRSKSAGSGPWQTDYIAMSLKSIIRRLCWRKLELDPSSKLAKALVEDDDEGAGRFDLDPAKEVTPGTSRMQSMLNTAKNGNGRPKEEPKEAPQGVVEDAEEVIGDNHFQRWEELHNRLKLTGQQVVEIINACKGEGGVVDFEKACQLCKEKYENHGQARETSAPTIDDVIALATRFQNEKKGTKFTQACRTMELNAGDVLTKRVALTEAQISELIDLLNAE